MSTERPTSNMVLEHTFAWLDAEKNITIDQASGKPVISNKPESKTCYFILTQGAHVLFQRAMGGKPILPYLFSQIDVRSYQKKIREAGAIADVADGESLEERFEESAISMSEAMAILDPKFVKTLAASMYVPVDAGATVQNIASFNAFMESPVADICANDFDFCSDIVQYATASVQDYDAPKKEQAAEQAI